MNKLHFNHVSFAYGQNTIIDSASFSINEHELIGIVGPNGGGKTTLLQLIMGFLTPTHGSIDCFGYSPNEFQKHIGYVPQITTFDPLFPISVFEVVMQGAESMKKGFRKLDPKYHERALFLLDRLGLLCKKDYNFFSLSGGQAQRALIARALLNQPRLLILDEPTSNVDRQNEKILFTLLKELKKETTILIVSHNLESLTHEIDKALLVNRSICSLDPHELCKHYSLGIYHPPIQINRP